MSFTRSACGLAIAVVIGSSLGTAPVVHGSSAAHRGLWSSKPLFTPTCYNGVFPNQHYANNTGTAFSQDPTRTFCCGGVSETCQAEFVSPIIPQGSLPGCEPPSYPRRRALFLSPFSFPPSPFALPRSAGPHPLPQPTSR